MPIWCSDMLLDDSNEHDLPSPKITTDQSASAKVCRNSLQLSWWTSPRQCSVQAERRRCWAALRMLHYRRQFSMSWGHESQPHHLCHSHRLMNYVGDDCLLMHSHRTSSPGLADCCTLSHNAERQISINSDFQLNVHTTDLRCFNTAGLVKKAHKVKVILGEQKPQLEQKV